MDFLDPTRLMRVGMRSDPVASNESDLGQQAPQFRIALRRIIVKNTNAMSGANRLHLCNHAAAFVSARHKTAKDSGIIQSATVSKILDVRHEQTAGQFGLAADRSLALEIAIRSIDAQRVVGQLRQDKPPLFGTIQGNRNVSFSPRQREGSRQWHELDHQPGMTRGERAKMICQEIIAKSVRGSHAHGADDRLRRASNTGANSEEFTLCALGCRDERLACRSQSAAGCVSFKQLGVQTPLKRRKLPRYGCVI